MPKKNRLEEFLKNPDSFTELDLSNKMVGDYDCIKIAAVLKDNNTVTTLNLENSRITDEGIAVIAKALQTNFVLRDLYLAQNQIGDRGAIALGELLKVNACLSELHLGQNQIGNVGAAALGGGLENNSGLTYLHLYQNHIGNIGAGKIGEGLANNSTLETLHLDSNRIGDMGAAAIGKALETNTGLKSLYFGENQIGDKGAAVIVKGLKANSQLESLWLHQNQIGGEVANDIADIFKERETLGAVSLQDNNIEESVCSAIQAKLGKRSASFFLDEQNKTLRASGSLVDDGTDKLADEYMSLVSENDFITLQRQIDAGIGVNLDRPDSNGRSLLWYAVAFGRKEMVQILIKSGLELKSFGASDKEDITPLKLASLLRLDDIVDMVTKAAEENFNHHVATEMNRACSFLPHHITGDPKDLFTQVFENFKLSLIKKDEHALHFWNIAKNDFNKILAVISEAVTNPVDCLTVNNKNTFLTNYDLIKDRIPYLVERLDLSYHKESEFFLSLDLLSRLRTLLNFSWNDTKHFISILCNTIETIAAYVDNSNLYLQYQIQDYGYYLGHQYEHVKFFAGLCGAELPGSLQVMELIQNCSAGVAKELEYQITNLNIDNSITDINYYLKAIEYLNNYPKSTKCLDSKALAYASLAEISLQNKEYEEALQYCLEAAKLQSQLPGLIEKLAVCAVETLSIGYSEKSFVVTTYDELKTLIGNAKSKLDGSQSFQVYIEKCDTTHESTDVATAPHAADVYLGSAADGGQEEQCVETMGETV